MQAAGVVQFRSDAATWTPPQSEGLYAHPLRGAVLKVGFQRGIPPLLPPGPRLEYSIAVWRLALSGYVKLFSDIVESSIWKEPPDICKVWITMLALCDRDGYIRGSPGWLAGKAQVSLECCQTALAKFAGPDQYSRTPDNEGKRIEILADGWLVLNYLPFRDRLSDDFKATQTRERVRRHRERYNALRNATSVTSVTSASASVLNLKEEGCKGGDSSGGSSPDGEALADPANEVLTGANGNGRRQRKPIPVVPPADLVITIPLAGNTGEYPISRREVQEWRKLFPAVDVPQTLNEIRAWNLANPSKRKTASGVIRHVVAWLSKEQNRPDPADGGRYGR